MYGTRQPCRGVVDGELKGPAGQRLVHIPEMTGEACDARSEFVWVGRPRVTEIEKLM
jgi:hypothetical protein